MNDTQSQSTEVVYANLRRRKLLRFVFEVLIIIVAVGPPLAGFVGFDFSAVYREAALTEGFVRDFYNPWPAVWLYYPFAILPLRLGAALWGLAQAIGYIYALRKLGGNIFWFAVSLPCLWTFTQGQSEGFLAWGLVLGLTSPPLLAGLGLTLLSLKPQFGVPVMLYILYKRRDWKTLVIPVAVYAISLAVWGFWFDDWFRLSVLSVAGTPQSEVVNISVFPYTLALLPLSIVMGTIPLLALVFSLALPYFALYTYAPILTMKWESHWSIPVMVIGSWLVMLADEQGISVPNFQIMALVALATLAIEGYTHLQNKKRAQPVAESG